MKLVIVRHGDPDYTIDSLTEKGFREAELLSDRIMKMNPQYCFCSPLGRAKDTAAPALKKLAMKAETLDWLREFNGHIINPQTGKTAIPWDLMPSFWTSQPDMYDKNNWLKTPVMQNGDVEEKYKMVVSSLDSLLKKHGYEREENYYRAVTPNSDTIVFFCHFGVECVLLSHLLGVSPLILWHGFVALPTSVTTLTTEEREDGVALFRCSSFGDLSHLYKGDEPPAFAARFCEMYQNKDERH